jgi:hypothetical protein
VGEREGAEGRGEKLPKQWGTYEYMNKEKKLQKKKRNVIKILKRIILNL